MQVPQAKVVRDGSVALVPAVDVVPGDIVQVEAGDIVPADGRIVRSATLETQEAALTGESAPIAQGRAATLPGAEVALGDRSNMLFQNTAVTRGTAAMVVTATGDADGDGSDRDDADRRSRRTRSPLQKELGSLTKVLGIIAWGAVAFIVIVGVARGEKFSDVLLLGTAMAISAIPTGMPAFVSGLLSMGAKQLADSQGGGQEPHRRRDARRDERDQHRQDRHADDERDDGLDPVHGRRLVHGRGRGLPQDRGDHVGRRRRRCRTSPGSALGLVLDSDATVGDDGARGRRSDRGRARRARGQARRRRRGDAPRLPAPRRGAVRLRLQVHGHLPPRHAWTAPSA